MKKKRGKERKKEERRGEERRGEALGVLQEPLEEGDAVRFSTRLECLVSGLGLTVCLALVTVAQQRVQQLSHPPLPLPKPLDHRWELKGHRQTGTSFTSTIKRTPPSLRLINCNLDLLVWCAAKTGIWVNV